MIVNNIDHIKTAIEFFKLSSQYLNLVEAVLDEVMKQGNLQVVISDNEITEEEFLEKTKWSDYNIAEPLFFNFYHGIELLLKGYLSAKKILKKTHNLYDLFSSFKDNYDNLPKTLEAFEKYIGKKEFLIEPLFSFYTENDITPSQYYEALRYPMDKEGITVYKYTSLKELGDNYSDFFIILKSDIVLFQKEMINYVRNNKF